MSVTELKLLIPVLMISVGILVLLLQASWKRSPLLSQAITVVFIGATALVQLINYPVDAQAITMLFTLDQTAAFFTLLVLFCAFSVALFQGAYSGNAPSEVMEEFYLLLLLSTLGAMLLVMAHHAGAVILTIELMTLPLLAMLAYNRQRAQGLEAALKYLLLSGASTSLLLLGFAALYANSGSLFLPIMSQGLLTPLALAGLVLVIAGLAFKLSLVPLHYWTPDVYQGAPVNVTLLLTSVSKVAAFALLFKLIMLIPEDRTEPIVALLSLMAIASMLIGNWLALMQNNLKRLMAYSAIAHMGYVLVAAITAMDISDSLMIEGASYYLVAYMTASVVIFACIIRLSDFSQHDDKDNLKHLQGLFWQHPWLAISLTLAMLSLAGMPITIGFIGKFYLLTTAITLSAWSLVIAMVIGSAVGLYYYLRVIFNLFSQAESPVECARQSWSSEAWVTIVTLLILVLGVFPGILGDRLNHLLMS